MVFGTLAWDSHGTRNELSFRSEECLGCAGGDTPEISITDANQELTALQDAADAQYESYGDSPSVVAFEEGMKAQCFDEDCPPNHHAVTKTDGKGDEKCECVPHQASSDFNKTDNEEGFLGKLVKSLFSWQGGAYAAESFHSEPCGLFSECASTMGEGSHMKSRYEGLGIEIPSWTLAHQSDTGGIPVESFERTFEVPFGTITQHKKVTHPDPANQVGDTGAWVGGKPTFKVEIHSELTPDPESEYANDTPSTTIQDDEVDDPFHHSIGKWELSGLDDWFTTTEADDDDDENEDDGEEVEEGTMMKKPTQASSKTGLYILGGIGILAAGYLYFIIRNPQAYVQATAIRTGGNLLGQALS
jgi:hypothetical protein